MYDRGKIIAGLALFAALVTLPAWYNALSGGAAPELAIVNRERHCVEPRELIRARHKELLSLWRERVVRDGLRTYEASDGQRYRMSLTGTCLGCHTNKEAFCDRCHTYVGVTNDCWNCHLVPPAE